MVDLHRHDEQSAFDGFDKPSKIAKVLKALGHTSMAISNHGTATGLTDTYFAAKAEELKPILGVEVYFQPVFKRIRKYYHLCIFAKNLKGYQNLCKIISAAEIKQKYYKGLVDFKLLEKYSEGIICTSACIGGFISQNIHNKKYDSATKAIQKFKKIFKEDFYIEIQPYKLSEKGMQEEVNRILVKMANKYDVKMILTSDSHYCLKEDYDSYVKMHDMRNHDISDGTYAERYIPSEKEIVNRFIKMHGNEILANKMIKNLEEIESKIDPDILDKLPLILPKSINSQGLNSSSKLKEDIIKGLKLKGVHNKRYISRCIEEYNVIKHHGFEDYFLMVADYVKYAKDKGIYVGPGRGSVCNSLVAYALNITEVDSLYFDLEFARFMRLDKAKLPDIDLDFETSRRQEVIDYIIKTYKGKAAQICSFGLYRVDNLLNDLFKVCNVAEVDSKNEIKKYIKGKTKEGDFDYDKVSKDYTCKLYNQQYDNIIKHFSKMYKKVRFIGTHAAGVAVTGGNLLDYTPLEKRGDKISTSYDLENLENINVIKFDMLGLRTLSILKELDELSGKRFSYDWLKDKKIMEKFGKGDCEGIFQFESINSQNLLQEIEADCFEDVVAASALNRPGPISLGMPAIYKANKTDISLAKETFWYDYTKETHGTIVYQEQIMAICRGIGGLSFNQADKVMKMLKGGHITEKALRERQEAEQELRDTFRAGAKINGFTQDKADEIFDNVLVYSFNKGHAVGYSLISVHQMYYKVYYPEIFWFLTLKYASNDNSLHKLKVKAVAEGNIIFIPHVNYDPLYSLQKLDGDNILVEGYSNIKNIGEKAALAIHKERISNGPFEDKEDFLIRVSQLKVNKRVISSLEEAGALVFDKNIYFNRVKQYNSMLYLKGINNGKN